MLTYRQLLNKVNKLEKQLKENGSNDELLSKRVGDIEKIVIPEDDNQNA